MGLWSVISRATSFTTTRAPSASHSVVRASILVDGSSVAAVGESHYQEALRTICAEQRSEPQVGMECQATIVAEPTNPYDPNAIKVVMRGLLVGYLAREDAMRYQPVMRRLQQLGFDGGSCEAWIAGRLGFQGNLGVWLRLGEPEDVIAALH